MDIWFCSTKPKSLEKLGNLFNSILVCGGQAHLKNSTYFWRTSLISIHICCTKIADYIILFDRKQKPDRSMLFFCPFVYCPIIGSFYIIARPACSIFLQPLSSLFCCCPRIKLQFLRHYGRRSGRQTWGPLFGHLVQSC